MTEPSRPQLPTWAARALAFLLGSTVALLITSGVLAWRLVAERPAAPALDDDTRRQVVREMAASNAGLFDAHPDPDVGRLLTAELRGFEHLGVRVDTNRFGLRERDYAVPKPAATVRVVLLGDSMVFGQRAEGEDRMGVFLERALRRRTDGGAPPAHVDVEVLHVGVPSWNGRNQVAFLRRQLSLIEPDLVLHILVPNDIEDDAGVRGFGAAAAFSPQLRHRADARIHSAAPYDARPTARPSLLRLGLDFESTSRYRALGAELADLHALLERFDIPYAVLFHFRRLGPVAWEEVGRGLEDRGIPTFYTDIDFGSDPAHTVAPDDPHWSRAGHQKIALALYDAVQKNGLAPSLELDPLDDAEAAFDDLLVDGRREVTRPGKLERLRGRRGAAVRAEIDFTALDDQGASQIYGGVDGGGELGPYGSLLLRGGGASLRLVAEPLGRPELRGARVRLTVDGEAVGEVTLDGGPVDVRFPAPAAAGKAFVAVGL
ncbi:MAG: hypothetical protein AAFX50_14795, partial [Acidobacteriota bacterium]